MSGSERLGGTTAEQKRGQAWVRTDSQTWTPTSLLDLCFPTNLSFPKWPTQPKPRPTHPRPTHPSPSLGPLHHWSNVSPSIHPPTLLIHPCEPLLHRYLKLGWKSFFWMDDWETPLAGGWVGLGALSAFGQFSWHSSDDRWTQKRTEKKISSCPLLTSSIRCSDVFVFPCYVSRENRSFFS